MTPDRWTRRFDPGLPRITADLNAVNADGHIRVWQRDFDKAIRPGCRVEIFEPNDETIGLARVVRINDRTGLVYLEVAWETLSEAASRGGGRPTAGAMTGSRVVCPTCQGSGRIPEFPDDYGVGEPCPRCREDGYLVDDD